MTKRLAHISSLLTYGIFMMSFISIIGSLYYQYFGDPVVNIENGYLFPYGQGLEPCLLCWYARILMYPIAPISLMGMLRNDRNYAWYVLPLSIMGIGLEGYHFALQMLPIANVFECTSTNPCDAVDVVYAGFITIPFLCLIAFVAITAMAGYYLHLARKEKIS